MEGTGRLTLSLVASYTPIEAALERVKLFGLIREGGGHVGSRLAVPTFGVDRPGTSGPHCESSVLGSERFGRGRAGSSDWQHHLLQPSIVGRDVVQITFGFP
jgi:hypothetical protein